MLQLHLDARLHDLPLHTATLDVNQLGQTAIDLFANQPRLPGIVLCRDRQFIGIVSRQAFLRG